MFCEPFAKWRIQSPNKHGQHADRATRIERISLSSEDNMRAMDEAVSSTLQVRELVLKVEGSVQVRSSCRTAPLDIEIRLRRYVAPKAASIGGLRDNDRKTRVFIGDQRHHLVDLAIWRGFQPWHSQAGDERSGVIVSPRIRNSTRRMASPFSSAKV